VYVTGPNGNPQNGVTLTVKAIPTNYLGRVAFTGVVWSYVAPIWSGRNEDANDGTWTTAHEQDDNGDGVLRPGNVIAVSLVRFRRLMGEPLFLTYASPAHLGWSCD
jgi:hypothetical protein